MSVEPKRAGDSDKASLHPPTHVADTGVTCHSAMVSRCHRDAGDLDTLRGLQNSIVSMFVLCPGRLKPGSSQLLRFVG